MINIKGEAIEQCKLFSICRYIPECRYLFHIPNGGSRNPIEAKNLKRQGVKAGVPDLFLPLPTAKYHGLFIEMKYGKNKPTPSQKEWIEYLSSVGYLTVVCYSAEEAVDLIKKYIGGKYCDR